MNYDAIRATAGPEVVKQLQDNDFYNREILGKSQAVAPLQLDRITKGAVILGIELTDYPLPDGITLYLQAPGGEIIALFIDADADEWKGGSWPVMKFARVRVGTGSRRAAE